MGKTLNSVVLSKTLTISECTDGFWLWDETRRMNLAMKAESTEAALVEAITYYQRRMADVESSYNSLKSRVESFVESVRDDEDDYHYCERCGSSS